MGQQIGDQLNNYRLVRPLGSGGFAEVWLGKHLSNQREAAIKVLKVQLPTTDDQTKFLSEARHLERLVHPHIVKLLDCGMEGDTPYLILEYAPNGTLRQRHPRRNVLPVDLVIHYVKQITAGLQYAHNSRIIHRDIKPENMLLNLNNDILLSDFGIALPGQTVPYPKTQNVMGTTGYMAPEQLNGHPAFRSDQYSLSVVVYEWLCGSLPFTGGLVEIIKQQQSTPPSLKNRVPGVTSAMEQVIFKALSYDVSERFRRVEDFAIALEEGVNASSRSIHLPPANNPPMGAVPQTPRLNESLMVNPSLTVRNNPGAANIPAVNNMPGAANIPPVNNAPGLNNIPAAANIPPVNNTPGAGNVLPVNNTPAANIPPVNNMPGAGSMTGTVNMPGLNNIPAANNIPPGNNGAGAVPGLNNIPAANNTPGVGNNTPAGGNMPGAGNPFVGNGMGSNTPLPPTRPATNTPASVNTPPKGPLNANAPAGLNSPPPNNQPPNNMPPYNQPPNNMPPYNQPQGPIVLPGTGGAGGLGGLGGLGAGGNSPFSPFNQMAGGGNPSSGGNPTSLYNQQTSLHAGPTIPAPSGFVGGNPFTGNQSPSQSPLTGPKMQSNWLAQVFDRHFYKQTKNQFFFYGGGIVDFLLAVALGFWLNAGNLSWNLWLGSFVVAWLVRALCAGVKPKAKYVAFFLASLLSFYWFVGSWALGTLFQNIIKFEPVPPHIIALLVGFAGLLLHMRYVIEKKR